MHNLSKALINVEKESIEKDSSARIHLTCSPDWISVGTMITFAGISLAPEEVVGFLKRELRLRAVFQQVVNQRIIAQAATERNLIVTPAEIQAEADRTRYELRLETAARTLEWLSEQLTTAEDWEAGICDRLLLQKLQDALFSQEVDRVFVQSRLDFEQISLYRIRVPYQPLAQELYYQIEESEISFYEAAHLYDIDEQRRLRCGFDGRLHRWSFEPDIASVVFGAAVGEVLGPFAIDQSYDLLMVDEFLPADLTAETRNSILERLFQEWLESEFNYFIHSQNIEPNS